MRTAYPKQGSTVRRARGDQTQVDCCGAAGLSPAPQCFSIALSGACSKAAVEDVSQQRAMERVHVNAF